MAVVCVVMNIADQQISDLNGRCQFPTKINESLEGCRFLLEAMEAGTLNCNVQITVRDTAPSISTSGTGSTQDTYVK
jgi:hypothetical protein